jgi:hypothetical protein
MSERLMFLLLQVPGRHTVKIYTIDRLSPESETLRHPFWSYAPRLKWDASLVAFETCPYMESSWNCHIHLSGSDSDLSDTQALRAQTAIITPKPLAVLESRGEHDAISQTP